MKQFNLIGHCYLASKQMHYSTFTYTNVWDVAEK